MTSALVCHLADLDLTRALRARGGSKTSSPQFLQGFVDGALDRDRHLIWEQLFSIEDGDEAARLCRDNLQRGFFNGASVDGGAAMDEEHEDQEDLQSLLQNLFSGSTPGNSNESSERYAGAAASFGPSAPPPSVDQPASFHAFTGSSHRLDDDAAGSSSGGAAPSASSQSWAITFTSNLEVARKSRDRSRAEAKQTFHWTFSGRAVKKTPTGTESYAQGRQAGSKRKGQIDGARGAADRKSRRGPRLALTR